MSAALAGDHGFTAVSLAARYPAMVPRLVLVDVTPGVDRAKAEPIIAFVSGPERFASFDEILDRTVEHNPTRSRCSSGMNWSVNTASVRLAFASG